MIRRCPPSSRPPESGYVLLIAIFVIVIVMASAFLVTASIDRQRWMHRRERQDILLTAMTDAAVAMALSQLWGDPDYDGTKEPFGEGTITIETRRIDRRHVEVTVYAKYWGSARSGQAMVRLDLRPPTDRSPPRVLSYKTIPAPAEGGEETDPSGIRG